MSTETHVFFRGKLPTKAALSRAMKELGFPFAIKPATGSLEQQSGSMPMALTGGGDRRGVRRAGTTMPRSAEFAERGRRSRASSAWRTSAGAATIEEAVAGMCGGGGAGQARERGRVRRGGRQIAVGGRRGRLSQERPEGAAGAAKTTQSASPTALKRMLAPLLTKRSDLVLAHRLLLIRPVRHLMRGAEFEWSDHGTKCSTRPFIRPLYQPSRVFLNDAVFSESVENPDFEPMLFDRLAAEVFEPLGKISTIEDFIESNWGKRLWLSRRFHSILLLHGLEEAKAVAATMDEEDKQYLEKCKARLAVANRKDAMEMYHRRSELKSAEDDVERSKERQALLLRRGAVFEHYRVWEGEVARGHKIEQASGPSPFPAHCRRPARGGISRPEVDADALARLSPTWRQDPPETPGEIRFAVAGGTGRTGWNCFTRSHANRRRRAIAISRIMCSRSDCPRGKC